MSEAATDFIKALFAAGTELPVYICSLANERDDPHEPGERHVATRDLADISKFIAKWDRPRRGLFFAVGTLAPGTRRLKDNIRETIGLHADIDFKNIPDDEPTVREKLAGLRLPPSALIRSGNGLHVYWLFKEALALPEGEERDGDVARLELALRQLADLLGGDLSVCEVSRLMRLPGTHNTKEGAWREVVCEHVGSSRYELDDIEEWLSETAPVIRRKPPAGQEAAATIETNPFLVAAARLGFKPSLDVEQRLAAMSYGGSGDSSIHNTQLAVSASMLNAGHELEDVVSTLVDATRAAAGEYADRWNWRREEKALRKMCESWVKKHPRPATVADPKPAQSAARPLAATGTDNVVAIAEARAQRQPKKRSGDVPVHIVLGEAVIAAIRHRGDDIIFTPKAAYRYMDGLWKLEIDGLRAWLDVEIETGCRELNVESNNRLIAETRQWITRNPELWREGIEWDAHGKIPTRSGLIDPRTLELTAAAPEHYCTWRIDCSYEPAATCPWWLTMLADFFGDRSPDSRKQLIAVIQEVLGAALLDIKPRSLSKAFILQGGSNFGKSGVLEVMGGLFSDEQIATGLEALEGSHGLMAFTRRLPWVLHEAFDQRKWHFSSMVKAIITGEPVNINIKNGPMLSTRVKAPIFWGTNHPPQFKEATKAIINRMIVIECRREFFEGQPIGAAAEAYRRGFDKPSTLVLNAEMPGLLTWAIAGLQRALQRGFIDLPEEVRDTADEIRRDSNLVAGFMEECVEFNANRRVSVPDFCAAFSVWWLENKGEDRRLPSNDAIGKAMLALSEPRVAINQKELRDKNRRYYAGIMLNEEGEMFWRRAVEAKTFEGKTASTTSADKDVNTVIPEEWAGKKSVFAMRVRQGVGMGDTSKNEPFSSVTSYPSVTHPVTHEVSPCHLEENEVSPTQPLAAAKEPLF